TYVGETSDNSPTNNKKAEPIHATELIHNSETVLVGSQQVHGPALGQPVLVAIKTSTGRRLTSTGRWPASTGCGSTSTGLRQASTGLCLPVLVGGGPVLIGGQPVLVGGGPVLGQVASLLRSPPAVATYDQDSSKHQGLGFNGSRSRASHVQATRCCRPSFSIAFPD
ncbi:hypothetical protein HaLaN_10472, partial [Haematococcus lacustris]